MSLTVLHISRILSTIIITAIAIQFVPYGKDHANPSIVSEPNWDKIRTRELFYKACFDCHSHETVWPWYSNFAPVSWLIQRDVDEGREHFNVSMWGAQKKNEGDDAVKEVKEGKMPPWFYLIPNPSTRLSESEEEEYTTLEGWTTSEYINDGPGGVNRLGVLVKGTKITGFINGLQVFELNDGTFSKGSFEPYISMED